MLRSGENTPLVERGDSFAVGVLIDIGYSSLIPHGKKRERDNFQYRCLFAVKRMRRHSHRVGSARIDPGPDG